LRLFVVLYVARRWEKDGEWSRMVDDGRIEKGARMTGGWRRGVFLRGRLALIDRTLGMVRSE
jgi:hypothetical protein